MSKSNKKGCLDANQGDPFSTLSLSFSLRIHDVLDIHYYSLDANQPNPKPLLHLFLPPYINEPQQTPAITRRSLCEQAQRPVLHLSPGAKVLNGVRYEGREGRWGSTGEGEEGRKGERDDRRRFEGGRCRWRGSVRGSEWEDEDWVESGESFKPSCKLGKCILKIKK